MDHLSEQLPPKRMDCDCLFLLPAGTGSQSTTHRVVTKAGATISRGQEIVSVHRAHARLFAEGGANPSRGREDAFNFTFRGIRGRVLYRFAHRASVLSFISGR